MENKMFTPDYSKPSFTIKIEVFDNCSKVSITPQLKKDVTYHEVVGALETQKHHLIFTQREINIKASKKIKKPKK